ncbi:unnamed protein product, partial [Rotaria sp. Silwood2]
MAFSEMPSATVNQSLPQDFFLPLSTPHFSFDDDVSNVGGLFDAAPLPPPRLETAAAAPPPPHPPPSLRTTATTSSLSLNNFNQTSVDGSVSNQ